ncbi:GNAT family N-acetyltransferase [Kribbella sandramycini]|uniref:GNAT family N-acetyltransferase n=1 Tax=Kribbella sandramycini TaxID=60450 RepID=A0A7Y4P0G7_9ACTN|nr:GNAT family N-acetyltransferase [Kribbella sandramycini]MBB6569036.1 RimJ/RimL family protein N-acetyltransferase [Kribbella sandramycini]NOL41120.1 GNAT family N-acetyltransferase [Kribbella sandramycini]
MRTTERLVLRPFQDTDLPAWAALNADAEVMRYLGGPLTRAESDREAAGINDQWAAGRFGFLAIERAADSVFLGAGGLSQEEWNPETLEIGWRLAREHWGHGYASEAAADWLGYGFTELQLPRIDAMTDTPNVRSIAVMRRLGMTFDRTVDLTIGAETFNATVYSMTAETFRVI